MPSSAWACSANFAWHFKVADSSADFADVRRCTQMGADGVEDTFTGGDLTAELLIVDLTTMEITPIGPVEAAPPESINFTYKEGESPEEAAKRFIQSNIWAQVREGVKKVLEEGAGAQVTLR
jgi:hypothetical protein